MRLALTVLVLVALVAGLYFVLFAQPPAPETDSVGIAPATAVEPATAPADAPDLAPVESGARVVEPAVATPSLAPATTPARSSLTIVATGEGEGSLTRVFAVCRDGLARSVPLEEVSTLEWHASELAPGEYSISVSANGCLTATRHVVLGQPPRDERVDIALERAAVVRVRWQVDDGRPIFDALQSPGLLKNGVFLRVATDEVLRSLGDRAPNSRQTFVINVSPDTSARNSARRAPWPGAPPDAMCELMLASALPAVVCASVDGIILESVRVEDASNEVVFRTPIEFLRTVNASVRFCLVDDATGEPVPSGRFLAMTGAAVGRNLVEVGPSGCRVDPRLSAGKWLLHFRAPGHAPLFREVDLVGGRDLDLGDLRMQAPALLHVRASYADGTPATAVSLGLLSVERAAWGDRSIVSTDAEGLATFVDLSRDPYLLAVADARFTGISQVVQPEDGDRHRLVDLQVEVGVEIALDFGPRSATYSRAFVFDHDGRVVSILFVPDAGCAAVRLLPGDYVVQIEGEESARAISVTDESVVYDLR